MSSKFYLPFIAVLVFLVAFLEEQKNALPSAAEIRSMESTEARTLSAASVEFNGSKGYVTIEETKQVADYRLISHWIQSLKGENGFYTYSLQGGEAFTGLASDHNTDFHLAHSYLEGFEPFKVDNPMLPMLTIARKKNYQYDHEQYGGLMEIWQSSRQSYYYPSGDCEDHAILLADWLIESGYNAYVALGKYDNQGHAWVVLFLDGKEYVLEATQKSGFGRKYPLASTLPKYQPQYRFNRTEFWLNTGSPKTTQYASKHWKLMSRFTKQTL